MFRTMHFAWTTQLDWALLEGERNAAARFEVLDVQASTLKFTISAMN